MDGRISVSVKSILVTGLVLLGLVVAYLLGSNGGGSATGAVAAQATPAEQVGQRVIRMVGRGESSAVPDQLSFGLSVTAKQLDLDQALAESSATMKRVLAELEQYGVKDTDVQTTGLSMNPEYEYHSYSPPTLTGYRVTQTARVQVRDLTRAGKAISAAVVVGGNGVRVRGIALQIGDPQAVIKQARDAAVAEATAKAEQYAAATGQTLGEVLSIKEISAPARFAPQELAYDSAHLVAGTMAAVPIRAGTNDLSVRVEVAWTFE